jgi:hypothetical protein
MDPSQVLPQIPREINKDLTLEVKPVRILDYKEKESGNKKVYLIRVLWRNSQIKKKT